MIQVQHKKWNGFEWLFGPCVECDDFEMAMMEALNYVKSAFHQSEFVINGSHKVTVNYQQG